MSVARPFSARHPNLVAFLLAAGLAGIALLLFGAMSDPGDGVSRALFLAALVLLSNDSIETAVLGAAGTGRWHPDRWVLAMIFGWYFAVAMVLFGIWSEESLATRYLYASAAGAVFGAAMALFGARPLHGIDADRYDRSRPATATPRGAALYRLWPPAVIGLTLLAVALGPAEPTTLTLALPFLAFFCPYYPPAKGYAPGRHPVWPRLAGMVAFVVGLALAG